MDEIIKHFLCVFLKEQGFESVETKALLMLKEAFEMRLNSYLRALYSYKSLSSKQNTTLTDVLCLTDHKLPLILPSRKALEYEETKVVEECEFISPLANTVEKYIHIYDFMPTFPPTHTFKQTFVKSDTKENKSFSVKNRLEQSLRSENNLLRLIKSSGSLPPFINYLYKRNRYN
ncbi:hypothetical protein NGRA_2049 [Nosema granulosis]|uniref:Transcription factor TFIID subunit 8 C-terminal domain-containing protein n=1 Tax=Nosema granulosis TaxID=83296 RepID=A0A9P6KYT5_9MICR|nr:hypothetical protein NGRA_2049 [Nosema granulosis]